MTGSGAAIVEAFTLQIDWCASLGSPMYAHLLRVSRDDIIAGGPVDDVVAGYTGDPIEAALALRLLGGVHRLVLMGLVPDLARHYPSAGGRPDRSTLDADFLGAVSTHRGYLTDALSVAPQTNEVGRSAALLPGLLDALDGESIDIKLLEIGASGGLNLLLDKYRYEFGSWVWGDPGSRASIEAEWRGDVPASIGGLSIIGRRGCDVRPLNVATEEDQLRLLSFIWPDQSHRFRRTAGAIEIASDHQPIIDEADAGDWLGGQLAEESSKGTMTVLIHSVMWQYLPQETKASVAATLSTAAERATRKRPLAHVSFEPAPQHIDVSGFVVSVTRWPGGQRRVLGSGHAHGAWIKWG